MEGDNAAWKIISHYIVMQQMSDRASLSTTYLLIHVYTACKQSKMHDGASGKNKSLEKATGRQVLNVSDARNPKGAVICKSNSLCGSVEIWPTCY